MIKVGFLVEGKSDLELLKSKSFGDFFRECQIEIIKIIDTRGKDNMRSHKVGVFVDKLKKLSNHPDKIILLMDMNGAPCYTKRKEDFKLKDVDLIIIARQSIESWLLADTKAMRKKTGNKNFYERSPENPDGGAWTKLRNSLQRNRKKPTSKRNVVAGLVKCGFDIKLAAEHNSCPSARYFVERISMLAK